MSEITNYVELIKKAKDLDAIYRLIEIGLPAAPLVVDELRKSCSEYNFACALAMRNVLLRIQMPEMLPIWLRLLYDEERYVRRTAFDALGKMKDGRALQPILDRFLDPRLIPNARSYAAQALGELGNPAVIETLLKISQEFKGGQDDEEAIMKLVDSGNEDILSLLLDISVSLAKLGNQKMAQFVIQLTYMNSEEVSVLRAEATK